MGMLIGLVFWGAVIYGIVYLITRLSKARSEEPKREESPLDILKRRYALGEMDAEEYARRRKDLEV
jgi:putative membrane protein